MTEAEELELLELEAEEASYLSGIKGASSKGKIKSPVTDPIEQKQRINLAKQESFKKDAWYNRVLAGAGKTLYTTASGFKNRPVNESDRQSAQRAFDMSGGRQPDLTQQGTQSDEARDLVSEYNLASEGDFAAGAGEIGADIGMMAIPGSKIARGMRGAQRLAGLSKPVQAALIGGTEGAGSATLHQMQNLGAGRDVSLGEAGIETLGSAVLPYAGSKIGKGLQDMAPGVLHSSSKPVLSQMDAVNPPDFKEALDQGLVPWFGGLDKSQKLTGRKLDELGSARDIDAHYASMFGPNIPFNQSKSTMGIGANIPTGYTGSKPSLTSKSGVQNRIETPMGIKGNIPTGSTGSIRVTPRKGMGANVVDNVRKSLSSEMGSAKGKLTKETFEKSKEALDYWKEQGLSRSTMDKGKMTVEDALVFRQVIDDKVKNFKKNQKLSDTFDKVSKMMRRELNDFIRESAPRTGQLTDEMAKIIPYNEVLKRRIMQQKNNLGFGPMDMAAVGVGGGLGFAGSRETEHPLLRTLGAAALLTGGRRLVSTPGGASMLHSMGTQLQKPGRLRDFGSRAARSTIFNE